ncbi:hypothetical protein L3X38_032624 [Prunus dulcis]|uniref:Uncharacterized protein n=1 Tax=Prunus dulcis TaxID=3755 RepID=A0AAD4VGQ2_PRUDU|nr:hypothetical protein L3X38_032624 [Prunus dulcis]
MRKKRCNIHPPDINWDDLAVMCATLVKCLTNPPQKMDMPITEDDCCDDVIVGVQKKRSRGKSVTLGLVMKRQRSVARETPLQVQEIPNILDDIVGDLLRLVPRDFLLNVAKLCWE